MKKASLLHTTQSSFRMLLFYILLGSTHETILDPYVWLLTSAAVEADVSVRSPHKIIVFMISFFFGGGKSILNRFFFKFEKNVTVIDGLSGLKWPPANQNLTETLANNDGFNRYWTSDHTFKIESSWQTLILKKLSQNDNKFVRCDLTNT